MIDWNNYRQIVLGGINPSKFHLVKRREIQKYKNYTKYIMDFDNNTQLPATYMVGYFLPTIDGKKWMPVFNHDYGRIRKKLHEEFYQYTEKKRVEGILRCLYEIGVPCTALRIIKNYL